MHLDMLRMHLHIQHLRLARTALVFERSNVRLKPGVIGGGLSQGAFNLGARLVGLGQHRSDARVVLLQNLPVSRLRAACL